MNSYYIVTMVFLICFFKERAHEMVLRSHLASLQGLNLRLQHAEHELQPEVAGLSWATQKYILQVMYKLETDS